MPLPVPYSSVIPAPPVDVMPGDPAAVMGICIMFGLMSLGVGLWVSPPSFRRWDSFLRFGGSSCLLPASLNALLCWEDYQSLGDCWHYLADQQPAIFYSLVFVVTAGNVWALYNIALAPAALYRFYRRIRGVLAAGHTR